MREDVGKRWTICVRVKGVSQASPAGAAGAAGAAAARGLPVRLALSRSAADMLALLLLLLLLAPPVGLDDAARACSAIFFTDSWISSSRCACVTGRAMRG
jgi:hypothetical protein